MMTAGRESSAWLFDRETENLRSIIELASRSIVHIVVDDVTHYKETEISWDHWNLQAKLLKPLQRENGTMQLFLFLKEKHVTFVQ